MSRAKYVAVGNTSLAAYSYDGFNWSTSPIGSTQTWYATAYGNGRFVAISRGPSNVGAYSDDGINWTLMTMPSSASWSEIIYSDQFVAIAYDSNSIAYSSDGVTWSTSTMPAAYGPSYWHTIIYGNGYYVLQGLKSTWSSTQPSQVIYSSDLINWTIVNNVPSLGANNYFGAQIGVYGSSTGHYVFAGAYTNNRGSIIYSSDLTNWTYLQLDPADTDQLTLIYGNGYYYFHTIDTSKRSTDLINWTDVTGPMHSGRSSTYATGVMITTRSLNGSTGSSYSTNYGATWNNSTMPSNSSTWALTSRLGVETNNKSESVTSNTAITLNRGFFQPLMVTVSTITNKFTKASLFKLTNSLINSLSGKIINVSKATSSNIVIENLKNVLSERSVSSSTNTIVEKKSQLEKLIESNLIMQLSNLIELTKSLTVGVSSSHLLKKFLSLPWVSNFFNRKILAMKSNLAKVNSSTDGMAWTQADLPIRGIWSASVNNGSLLIAVSKDGKAVYTADGSTWNDSTMPAGVWTSIATDGTQFIATSLNSDKVAVTTDGETWTTVTMPSTQNYTGITYGNGKFVTVTDEGTGYYSADGITWSACTMPDALRFSSITYHLDQFTSVAVGPTNLAARSTDGITFERIEMPSVADWISVGPGVGNPDE